MARFGGVPLEGQPELESKPAGPRFGGQKVEGQPRFGGTLTEESSLADDILDSFVDAGKNVQYGYKVSAEHMYNLAANIPMLIHDASNFLAEQTGEKPEAKTVAKTVESWLREQAANVAPDPADAPQDIAGKIYSGIGAAPGTIAEFVPAVKMAGVVKGMAGVSALSEADKGLVKSVEAGVKGALLGGTLKAVQPLARGLRVPAMAGVGGVQAAAEGGDVSDVVSGAVVMGAMGAMGAREGLGVKDIMPKARVKLRLSKADATKPIKELIKDNPAKAEDIVAESVQAEAKTKEFAGNINLDKYSTGDSVKQLFKDTANQYDGFMEVRRGVVSHEATKQAARDLGLSEKEFVKLKGRPVTEAEAYAGRVLLEASGERVIAAQQKAIGGSDVDVLAMQEALTRHVAIQETVSGQAAHAGRLLNQYKIQVKSTKAKLDAIEGLIEANGGRSKLDAVAKALADPKSLAEFNKLTRDLVKPTPMDMTMEAWINGLLSGPQTHAVNMTSNTAVALLDIPQTAIAATLGSLRKGGDKVKYGEVLAKTFGFVEGAKIGAKRALETLRTGEPLDPLSKLETARHKSIPGKVGEVVRTPGRFLMAEDEFFKAIGYRMELNALAFREATNAGLKGRDLAKRIEELKVSPSEKMHDTAVEKSRYQTFTKELGPTGKNVQKLVAGNSALKFLMPFIRTPTNIVKYAGERTPLSLASKAVRAELKKGGAARDEQIAKIIMGGLISTATASLVQQGLITGGGSSDPRRRAVEYAAGRPPYSILIGDKYYSYSRIEPFGMLMGITADAAEIMDQAEKGEQDKMLSKILGSISKNLTSKTYLKGLSETFKMLDDPDRYSERWIQGYAGTVIPSLVSQTASVVDPVLRETHSNMEKIKSRIPIISRSLTPRHTLWGEEIEREGGWGPDIISPIYQSTKSNDKLLNELVDLDMAPSMPKKKIYDIELSPEQYAEYVVDAGKSAKSVLDILVGQVEWDNFRNFEKVEIIENVIKSQRDGARARLLVNYPDLIVEISEKRLEAATVNTAQ